MASSMMNGANLWSTTKSAFTGGFWGALGGMANFGIGSLGGDWYTRMALHSISDGTMEALQGGHFEHGLYVGMVSAGGNELISGYANHMTDVGTIATSAVLGGVVSEIGGGKFANGAMTSAFQMMYNHMIHDRMSKHDKLFVCSKTECDDWENRVRKKAFNYMIQVSHVLNIMGVKELRSYRSLWSLGVKPLVLSIGYKRNHIWLNSLTP